MYISETIPDAFKHTFYINSSRRSTRESFVGFIRFIKNVATYEGEVFDLSRVNDPLKSTEVKNLHPLLRATLILCNNDNEIERTVHLFILRESLYLVGFMIPDHSLQFCYDNEDYLVAGFDRLLDFRGNYVTKPWESVGINEIITAIQNISVRRASVEARVSALEVFCFHFCEATRFKLIEDVIAMTINVTDNFLGGQGEVNPYTEESNALWLGEERFQLDQNQEDRRCGRQLPPYVFAIMRNWEHLSRIWIKHVQEGGVPLIDEILRACHVFSVERLGEILGCLKLNRRKLSTSTDADAKKPSKVDIKKAGGNPSKKPTGKK